jgi:retinol-binding protein 3
MGRYAKAFCITLALLVNPRTVVAQTATPAGSAWTTTRAEVLARAERALENYYYTDRIAALRAAIEANRRVLMQIDNPKQFADALTTDLQKAAGDKHIIVWYSQAADENQSRKPTATGIAEANRFFQYVDYGYNGSLRLNGNIGYLGLGGFANMPKVKTTFDAAMTLVSHTEALIIDLRGNGGGDSDAVDYLLGYFFSKPTEVTGAIQKERGKSIVHHDFTPAKVGGPRYLNKPVYVLIDHKTISGGEMFAYDMKVLRRALIVGEGSAGAANGLGSRPYFLSDHLSISIPDAVTRNPYTGANWEGVGVTPDVETEAHTALLTAYQRAVFAVKEPYDPLGELSQARKDPASALSASLPRI